ncbi:TOMM precursor leader peptide-binding protein [Bacillus toyonensis]|uniref:TOMM precursor leader peptide-binding protein n=1 Tax=Bacillus toyonensis TaxID=155322 RepID=UPI0021D23A52|nr:TOMM precursor leader peptide-binding protein [Bacillus toyonensis]MCU5584259.1 TOMM precursor leader peptide-binding protein [Bacillus toyonensis]
MDVIVLLVGEGFLADRMYRELSNQYQVVRQPDFEAEVPAETALALVLHDAWHPAIHLRAEKVLRPAGVPWIRGFVSFGEGVVGPLIRSNTQGCSNCADMRRFMAGLERKEIQRIQQRLMTQEEIPKDAWASRIGLMQMLHLLSMEVQRVLKGYKAQSEEHMFLINLKTLKSTYHFFLSNSLCPVCSKLPDDSLTTARISLQPSLKINIDSYRCRSLDELDNVLAKDYLDYRTGFLNSKMYDLVSPFADASVNLPLLTGNEGTAGRTHSYEVSELTAILEGLERYCGLEPKGKRTVIYGSFNNLKEYALNPITVGVYKKVQYELKNSPYKPFNPKQEINWVWGYSFLQERPILVPEILAYFELDYRGFVYENSNGCALGGSLEEAIFYGILEVIERDSFLMTWYARLPLPRLDPYSTNDQELRLMVNRLQAIAGYEILLFNSTTENRIPSIWAVGKNKKEKGLNLICAAGAHIDPIIAAKGALHELSGMMLTLEDKFEGNREQYIRMFHDSSLVQKMEDHSMLYGLPQAQERLQFLLDDNRPLRTFAEEFKQNPKHKDLTTDLRNILQIFRRLNLDVIVVDQTTPEIARNGLHCVKVLIPGMLPMTFGHDFIRITGLERLLRVPMKLGYVKKPLLFEQLNPYPHPFP